MKVYSLVWFNQGIQDYSTRDHLEEMGQAILFDSLEKAKDAAEKEARGRYQENKEWEKELEEGDDPLPEPDLTWHQKPNWHGHHQLDPWGQADSYVSDWGPGWWAIREIEVG